MSPSEQGAPLQRTSRILYMEDDVTTAFLVRRKLEREGFVVDIAGDGEAGLAKAASQPYDLVALDVHMPRRSGMEVLSMLVTQEDAPPIVMVTAQNDIALAVEAMRLGAYDYLVKNLDNSHLLLLPGVIRRALQKRELERERVRTVEALRVQNRNLALLNRVSQLFVISLDVGEIAHHLVESICEFTDTDGSSVWLRNACEPDYLDCFAIYLRHTTAVHAHLRLAPGEGIAGWVGQHGLSVSVADAYADSRFSSRSDELLGFRTATLLALPMRVQDQVIGVLELVNKRGGLFSADDQVVAETLASAAALAIDKARLFASLSERTTELQNRNEELDAFAHTVAHDLKTPLALILGYADLLRDGYEILAPTEIEENLDQIIDSSTRMHHIIEALLALAGVRSGNDIVVEPLNMSEIVQEVMQRLSFTLRQYDATVHLLSPWPTVVGYGPWVQEVWYNYMANAIKYGGRPPILTLGHDEQVEGQVRFWVHDNGPGLAAVAQDLFKLGVRAPNASGQSGHGLGLSIVKRIVERLNGSVGIESEQGAGSTFWFTLPAAGAADANTA